MANPVANLIQGDGRPIKIAKREVHRPGDLGHGLNERAVKVKQDSSPHCARRFWSMMRRIMGVKMSCIESPILPPGTTMVLGRVIIEPSSIESR